MATRLITNDEQLRRYLPNAFATAQGINSPLRVKFRVYGLEFRDFNATEYDEINYN